MIGAKYNFVDSSNDNSISLSGDIEYPEGEVLDRDIGPEVVQGMISPCEGEIEISPIIEEEDTGSYDDDLMDK